MRHKQPTDRLSIKCIDALAARGRLLKRRMDRHSRSIDTTYWILVRLPDWLKPPVRWSVNRQHQRYERESREMIRIKHQIRRHGILPKELGI